MGPNPNALLLPEFLTQGTGPAQSWQIQARRRFELNPKVTQGVSTETQRIKYNFTKTIQERMASLEPLKSSATTSRREGNLTQLSQLTSVPFMNQ